MGQKVHAVAHRLGAGYRLRSKSIQDKKRGLGRHRGGWPTTRYLPTRKESREGWREVGRIRSAVAEWLDADETYIEVNPCQVVRYADRREIAVQVYGLGVGLTPASSKEDIGRGMGKGDEGGVAATTERGRATPKEEISLSTPDERGVGRGEGREGRVPSRAALTRQELTLGLERAIGRIGLSLPWSLRVEEVQGDSFVSAPMRAREEAREDTSRVSGQRRARLMGLARTTPVSPGLATARARYLEEFPSHKTAMAQVKRVLEGMVAESRSPASRQEKEEGRERPVSHGGSDYVYTPLAYGFEVVFRGTFDGSRRTMQEVVAGGKRKRRSISTPVSYGRCHAKTKTGTRGVRVYVAYY